MEIDALAGAFIGAMVAGLQLAIAGRMLRMNADMAAAALKVIDAAEQNMDRLANVAAGVGTNLDISV